MDFGGQIEQKSLELVQTQESNAGVWLWASAFIIAIVAFATGEPLLFFVTVGLMVLYRVWQVAKLTRIARLKKEISQLQRAQYEAYINQ